MIRLIVEEVMDNKTRTALIALVSVVWAANFMAPIFVKGFVPPAEINLAFMGIIGVLTASYKQGNGNGNGTSKKDRDKVS